MKQIIAICILFLIGFSFAGKPLYDNIKSCKPSLLFPGSCEGPNEHKERLGKIGREFKAKNQIIDLEPVLLIPGLAGSCLEVKLDKAHAPFMCYKTHEWYQLWLALLSMLPGEQGCFWDHLSVFYNQNNQTFYNAPGTSIRAMDFGGVKGLDYLDRDWFGGGISQTAYFAYLIADLVAAGFTVGHNLRGAPYDWRQSGDPNGQFYASLKSLIEEMYNQNNGKKVHVVAHSMGNIHFGWFLATVNQAWKDQYIASFIAVAGPWSGAPMALRTLISGNNLGLELLGMNLIDPLKVRQLARQAGGIIWLIPDIEYWNSTEIVKTPSRSYDVEHFQQLLSDAGTPISWTIHEQGKQLHDIPAPNVELHCLFGVNFHTEMHYTYKNGFDSAPEITYSNYGDGVVPGVSLQKCVDFEHRQTQPVEVKTFDLADHMTVLNDEELLQYVLKLVTIVHSDKPRDHTRARS